MSTKFPDTDAIIGVISNEGDVITPFFFEEALTMNEDA